MENLVTEGFWRGKFVLVTGATGLVGSWPVAELLMAKAHLVEFIHHPDLQSNLFQSGLYRNISIVQGNLEDYPTLIDWQPRYTLEQGLQDDCLV